MKYRLELVVSSCFSESARSITPGLDIFFALSLKELKVGQDWLLNKIKARKLSYFGHLKRHDSLERHTLEARFKGKRRKGRPTRRWTEDIKKWLQMSPTEADKEA